VRRPARQARCNGDAQNTIARSGDKGGAAASGDTARAPKIVAAIATGYCHCRAANPRAQPAAGTVGQENNVASDGERVDKVFITILERSKRGDMMPARPIAVQAPGGDGPQFARAALEEVGAGAHARDQR
jgi:hypothetical protein